MANGIEIKGPIPKKICGDFIKGKQQRKPSYKPISQSKVYLDYLHCDLNGPYPTTRRGNRFSLGIQDGTTMKIKDQAFDIFQRFICQASSVKKKA